ncbi:MAG: TIGR02588 family protein [Leptolyngbyaceae cyanobacterium bins.349]|nr:TIGR02588 family protein [Leptolyngbyaceae cyanobacterium bins.349]
MIQKSRHEDEVQINPEPQPEGKRPPRSMAEWVTFGVASLALGAIAGLVIYSWTTERDQPPMLTLSRPEPIRQHKGQFYIPFEIVNTGGETAESVQVVAELKRNGNVEETGDLQIDFLARNEREKGAFVFTQNPQDGDLVLRVSSYKVP